MFKKRTRPQPRIRQPSLELEDDTSIQEDTQEGDAKLDVADLIELRKLRRAREGIDVAKLSKGDAKKRKKRPREGQEDQGGLKKGADLNNDNDEERRGDEGKKSVRTNNFTQQTNTLDVDKHMMAFIEENMKLRRGTSDDSKKDDGPADPYAELFR
ncbi:hypothetical protein A0H81_09691 [Grifola frondosa]|uniref:Uncharacterized protein n=1 Tax=Grifola frondosa TaxID=5627 RepID=A0A1C7LZU2_GRIFR|nr:hypothetical protein A0H81_09691 [Grifola frondosa]